MNISRHKQIGIKKFMQLIVIATLVIVITGCSGGEAKNSGDTKLKVAVSIVPEEAVVKAIAGDLVDVVTIIPPGGSPANYQPAPKDIQTFNEASVYFSIGVPAEESNIFPNMVEDREDLTVIHLDEVVAEKYPVRYFSEEEEHEHEGEHEDEHHEDGDHEEENHEEGHEEEGHDHSGKDPHIWMSPRRMVVIAEEICRVLVENDSTNKEVYEANRDKFITSLTDVDKKLEDTLSSVQNSSFIIMHPSMGYFADDYGLEMVSIEQDGKESTAAHLEEVIDFAKDHDIKVVFYQEEFDSAQAKTIADEIDGEALSLDVLSFEYLKTIEEIGDVFADVLGK